MRSDAIRDVVVTVVAVKVVVDKTDSWAILSSTNVASSTGVSTGILVKVIVEMVVACKTGVLMTVCIRVIVLT